MFLPSTIDKLKKVSDTTCKVNIFVFSYRKKVPKLTLSALKKEKKVFDIGSDCC